MSVCFELEPYFLVQNCHLHIYSKPLLSKGSPKIIKGPTPVQQIKAVGAKRRGDYFVFDDNLKSSLTFF